MGLDIGVVGISYLERPTQPMYGFMWALMADPEVGLGGGQDEDDGYWDGGGSGENAFYQFQRQGLVNRATGWAAGWAAEQNLSDVERRTLLNWIANLPYQGETIMLHLSF